MEKHHQGKGAPKDVYNDRHTFLVKEMDVSEYCRIVHNYANL